MRLNSCLRQGATYILVLLLAYAGVAKWLEGPPVNGGVYSLFHILTASHPNVYRLATVAEIVLAIALFPLRTRLPALMVSGCLMAGGTGVAVGLRFTARPEAALPCGCFGSSSVSVFGSGIDQTVLQLTGVAGLLLAAVLISDLRGNRNGLSQPKLSPAMA